MINFLDVQGELTTLSSCICPGYEAVFECVVTGGGVTIWSGTAFDHCSQTGDGSGITLRHSEFIHTEYNSSQSCGESGPIIGRAVSIVNGSYISQLTINITQSLIGTNVDCTRKSNGTLHVGTEQILLTTGIVNPYSPKKIIIIIFYRTAPTSK